MSEEVCKEEIKKSIQVKSIDFCSMLTILFIGLKLAKVIDWSWWWVLAPAWIPVAIAILVAIIIVISVVIVNNVNKK
jgi:uncharacterized protein (DUF983 family)